MHGTTYDILSSQGEAVRFAHPFEQHGPVYGRMIVQPSPQPAMLAEDSTIEIGPAPLAGDSKPRPFADTIAPSNASSAGVVFRATPWQTDRTKREGSGPKLAKSNAHAAALPALGDK